MVVFACVFGGGGSLVQKQNEHEFKISFHGFWYVCVFKSEAKWQGSRGHRYYPGTIAAHSPDFSRYDIAYDDGDFEKDVLARYVRLPRGSAKRAPKAQSSNVERVSDESVEGIGSGVHMHSVSRPKKRNRSEKRCGLPKKGGHVCGGTANVKPKENTDSNTSADADINDTSVNSKEGWVPKSNCARKKRYGRVRIRGNGRVSRSIPFVCPPNSTLFAPSSTDNKKSTDMPIMADRTVSTARNTTSGNHRDLCASKAGVKKNILTDISGTPRSKKIQMSRPSTYHSVNPTNEHNIIDLT